MCYYANSVLYAKATGMTTRFQGVLSLAGRLDSELLCSCTVSPRWTEKIFIHPDQYFEVQFYVKIVMGSVLFRRQ